MGLDGYVFADPPVFVGSGAASSANDGCWAWPQLTLLSRGRSGRRTLASTVLPLGMLFPVGGFLRSHFDHVSTRLQTDPRANIETWWIPICDPASDEVWFWDLPGIPAEIPSEFRLWEWLEVEDARNPANIDLVWVWDPVPVMFRTNMRLCITPRFSLQPGTRLYRPRVVEGHSPVQETRRHLYGLPNSSWFGPNPPWAGVVVDVPCGVYVHSPEGHFARAAGIVSSGQSNPELGGHDAQSCSRDAGGTVSAHLDAGSCFLDNGDGAGAADNAPAGALPEIVDLAASSLKRTRAGGRWL